MLLTLDPSKYNQLHIMPNFLFLLCYFSRTWENLVHVFVEEDMKDQAKAAFGYTAVPFYVVFDKVIDNSLDTFRTKYKHSRIFHLSNCRPDQS